MNIFSKVRTFGIISVLSFLFILPTVNAGTIGVDADGYVLVNPTDLPEEVLGDGSERGLRVTIKGADLKTVFIPDESNFADCRIKDIKFLPRRIYEVTVDTSVEADAGGCDILANDFTGKTVVLIRYTYQTDY